MDRLSDTALLAMSAFDDGYGAWGEAETSIAGACALPKVGASAIRGGTDDIDGDGTRDLVVIRDLGTGAERIPRPQVYSSLDLDALNLDQGAALSILALSDETYSVTSGADIDGGITDLVVASRTYTAGDWSDQDVVFFGPLAGVRDQGQRLLLGRSRRRRRNNG